MSETLYAMGAKRLSALDEVDRMSPGLRQCVHEFGLPLVRILVKHGVREPKYIREIVKEAWFGARQDGQTNGIRGTLDSLLATGPLSSAALSRLLLDNHHVIVSMEPTRAMLTASMTEVSSHNVICTREEKHRRRLRAALRAAALPTP